MTVVLGVDPGVSGGLAMVYISPDNRCAPKILDVIDVPNVGVDAKQRIDVIALIDWITKHHPQHAYIERAQAMPKQGSSSGFKYGRAVGAIEAVVVCCHIPLTIVEPTTWRKFHRLHGHKNKEPGRQRALQLFPDAHALFARKKDHGRADAALIALAGSAYNNGQPAKDQRQPGRDAAGETATARRVRR